MNKTKWLLEHLRVSRHKKALLCFTRERFEILALWMATSMFVLHTHLTRWILKVTPSYSWRSLLSGKKNNLQWRRQRWQMIFRVHISMRSSYFLLIPYCSSCVSEMVPCIWTRNAIGNDLVPLNTRSRSIMIFRSGPKVSGNSDIRESPSIFC